MEGRITTLIADDEPLSLAALRAHADLDPDLTVVAECPNGTAAVEAIHRLRPELLLLDVQMPLLDGFEVLNHVAIDPEPAVIFVTAHRDYAVQAFDVAAADFLVKPFDASRFSVAVSRAKDAVYRRRADGEDLAASGSRPPGVATTRHIERLLVRESGRIVVLPVRAINRIESAGNYLRVHTRRRPYLIRMKMVDMERLLDPRVFARVHRTSIINMNRVASLASIASGNYILTLNDGTELRMSRQYSAHVLDSYFVGGERYGA